MTKGSRNIVIRHVRNGFLDGEQYVDAVAVDRDGRIVAEWGRSMSQVITHSSCKPFHSVAFVESGAVDAFELSDKEVALSAASQGGESFQRFILEAWLKKIDLEERHLLCGTHPPLSATAREELSRQALKPSVFHHNSAGKHIGMLTMCLHLGFPTENYVSVDHPLQKYIWEMSSRFLETEVNIGDYALERCETVLPVVRLPSLARAAVKFCSAHNNIYASSTKRVLNAFIANPELITYPSHYMIGLNSSLGNILFVKQGSYAVCVVCHMPSEVGIAFKIRDGIDGLRLSCIVVHILHRIGLISDAEFDALSDVAEPPIMGSTGKKLGHTKIVFSN